MKQQKDTATRRRGDAGIDRFTETISLSSPRRVAASPRRRVTVAGCVLPVVFCLLSCSAHRADGLSPASPISKETAAWLLKQARGRFAGKAIDDAAAPPVVTAARPTTLLVTTFRRGLIARPLAGSGASLLAALKAALDSLDPQAQFVSSAPEALANSSPQPSHAAKPPANSSPQANRPAASSGAPDRIQIDLLDGEMATLEKPAEIEREAQLSAAQLLQPGVEGIAIEARGQVFYLPPSQL